MLGNSGEAGSVRKSSRKFTPKLVPYQCIVVGKW